MQTTDQKRIDESTYAVRQSFNYFIVTFVTVQIIILLTVILVIYALGFIGPSTFVILPKAPVVTFIIFILIIADLLVVASLFLSWKNTHYIIRPNEIVARSGVLDIKEKSYQLNQVESVTVLQGFFGRLLNYGSMRIYSPMLESKVTLFQIPSPNMYRDMLVKFSQVQQQQDASKKTSLIPDIDGAPV